MKIQNKTNIDTRDIVLMGAFIAIIEAAKILLSPIAGVEMVTLLLILSTLYFRKKMPYMLLGYLLIEGILNGFSIWWVMYIYIWSLLVLLTYLFRNMTSIWCWSIFSGVFGIIFGALCCPIYFITNGVEVGIAWWIAGLPTDILHGVSNFVLCLVLFKPLNNILGYLKRQ